jgi:ATP-binding protein involved in chromosome partitioning
LDADVFGPSIPRMLNLSEQKPQVTDTQQLLPLSNYGIKCMSMGFLAEKVRTILFPPLASVGLSALTTAPCNARGRTRL